MPTTEDHKELEVYEVGYLILPSIPEEKVSDVVSKLTSAITSNGGILLDGEEPHKRDLAYQISKTIGASRYVLHDAYVGWQKFEGEPESAVAIKAALEKIEEVVRFLLTRAPRETTFTFAKAMEAEMEREAALEEAQKEAEAEPVAAPAEEV